jgi:hypothetical protein
VTADAATAIDRYFAHHGRQRHRLSRVYRPTVELLVAQHGVAALDRIEVDIDCPCCDEERARKDRLSWVKAEYHRRGRRRHR